MNQLTEDKLRKLVRKYLREAEDDKPKQGQEPTPPQKKEPPVDKPKSPTKEKEPGLKYEMKYVNGGFNSGVKIEPTNGGKIALSISIYGGGEPKKVKLPASPEISKIIQGYEIAVKNNDKLGLTMEPKLDQYLQGLEQEISLGVIKAMQEFDQKVKQIILNTIRGKNENQTTNI